MDSGHATHSVGDGIYRFYLIGPFSVGAVNVTFTNGGFADDGVFTNLEEVESFTVQGPTADLFNPRGGGVIGIKSLNDP